MILWFFRGSDGSKGREKRKKEKKKQTQNHTEPRDTHFPFLPPLAVFLMIPDGLLIAFGHSCQCLCCCMLCVSGPATHRDLESVFSKSISVGTRIMANCAREGQSQGKLWWRLPAMLMCKPNRSIYIGEGRKTNRTILKACMLSPEFPRESWSGTALSVGANDQRKSGTCCSRPALKHSVGKIEWLLSVNLRWTCYAVFFVFFNVLLFLSLLSPSSPLLTPPVCSSRHASVCRFKTPPGVPATRPHVSKNVDVLPVHTGTFGIDTRRRVRSYTLVLPRSFSTCHTKHTANQTHTHTQQHHTH